MSHQGYMYAHVSATAAPPSPYQTTYSPNQSPRPTLLNSPSQKSYTTGSQPGSTWPTSWNTLKPQALITHYGVETWLSFSASIVLLSAAGFSLYASSVGVVFPVSSLSGKTLNVPNVSALISGLGAAVAAALTFSLSILGRRWILRQVEQGNPITIGQWSAIASNGSIANLIRAWKISWGLFLVGAILINVVGSALSGALVPSLVTGSSISWVEVVRLSGAYGKPYAKAMVECDSTLQCPANYYGSAMDTAMLQALTGTPKNANGFYTIGESRYESLRATSSQPQIEYAVLRVPSHRLNDRHQATSIEACMPAVTPVVTCAVSIDPSSVRRDNDSFITFTDMCGQSVGARLPSDFGTFSWLCNSTDDTHLLSYIWYEQSSFTRYDCSVTATEDDIQTLFKSTNSVYERGESCGGSVLLNTTEMLPMVSSVVTRMQLSQYSNNINAQAAMLYGGGEEETRRLEKAIEAGMSVAAMGLYFLARGSSNEFMATSRPRNYTPTFPRVSAVVQYRAYGWDSGYKAYAWGAILCILGVLALLSAFLGTKRRLRYDPSDWAQTVMIALNSRDLVAPNNTDTGILPKDYASTEIQYGRIAQGQAAQFTTAIPCHSH